MSVNLDNVKAIVHNNKNVVKIEDSHGIIWQAPSSEGWHTVWSGSESISVSSTTSPINISSLVDFDSLIPDLSQTRLKITFSCSTSGGLGSNTSIPTNITSLSEYEFTYNLSTTSSNSYTTIIQAQNTYSIAGGSAIDYIKLRINRKTGVRMFQLNRGNDSSNNMTGTLTITKIEVYY